ncbi:hypothetical protein PVPAM_050010100 [Plasmodium vivax]|nr:hypothetical protein PVPAM_050010100 [Plasmodium vivax]
MIIFNGYISADEATSTGNDVPLSTFSVDDDPMSIKTYITYSLIPLAFILLLMLIIKFTPLGMLFTKKKRKNRKLMNERLQRILLDNSNLRQRNVPLAYGAFDYQYNNQNYY